MATTRQIKKQVMELLQRDDLYSLNRMLKDSQRVLSALFSMTYDKDSLLAWKAIRAYGILLVSLAEQAPEQAGEQVRRLLWSVTEESGGLGWAAIEILTEVICNARGKMDALVPLLNQYAEESVFVPSVLYALRRLTECLNRVPWPEDEVWALLEEAQHLDSPEVRGHLVLAYAKLKGYMERLPELNKDHLLQDHRPFTYYDGHQMRTTTVAALTEEVLN